MAALFGDSRPQGRDDSDEHIRRAQHEPTVRHNRLWSSLNVEGESHGGQLEVFGWMRPELTRRDPNGKIRTVCAAFLKATPATCGGLRQMGTRRKLRGNRRDSLRRIGQYLENNRDRLRHDEDLAAGYPIASGVIEGACRYLVKYLVKDRMERSGMRWTVPGAQAMIDLRSTHINGRWNDFQSHRIKQENERLDPHAEAPDYVEWPLAA